MSQDLRYPIGPFRPHTDTAPASREGWIAELEALPASMRDAVAGLTDAQLDTPYRDGGWTVRQVVHHVPDSHLNAYVRTCWALTEEEPPIKAYDEAAWAELPFSRSGDVEVSLGLLDGLHRRWTGLLRSLDEDGFARALRHPEAGRVTVGRLLDLYAWHGRHHVGHILALRRRMGW